MVSDTVLIAIAGVVGTLLGALLGFFAEPFRARIARKAHQEQLRKTLYGDLTIKLQRVLGYYLEYESNRNNLEYLKSLKKLEVAGTISFPDEVTAQERYYQLTYKEAELLATAYFRLRWIVNFVNQFGDHPLDIINANQALQALEYNIRFAAYAINLAFKDSAHFLEKIDPDLLQRWHALCYELVTAPQWRKLQLQEYLQDCVQAAQGGATEEAAAQGEATEEEITVHS